MGGPSSSHESPGDWVLITPVGNLVLTSAVDNEFRVDRVTFIAKSKLFRVRTRLGLPVRMAGIKKLPPSFEAAEAFALVRHKGTATQSRRECVRLVREELSILAASRLGFGKRRFFGYVGILGEYERGNISNVLLNRRDASRVLMRWGPGNAVAPLRLDGTWKAFQRRIFFSKLLRILRKEIPVAEGWRNDLRRAAILIGQSTNSTDLPTAFLWNMIALDLLFAQANDKYLVTVPKRVEAFLGWVSPDFGAGIPDVYRKRNALVHAGDRQSISARSLLFTDDLLLNLIMNLVSFPRLFNSRDKVMAFADKFEAEQRLGLSKSKVRPKGLRFLSRSHSAEDYELI